MNKKLLLAFVALAAFVGSANAYQQQGFTNYTEETDGTLTFSCAAQCALLMDDLGGNDVLRFQGVLEGSGSIGYGYLVGQTVYPATLAAITDSKDLKRTFAEDPLYPQVSKQTDTKVVLLVYGRISTKAATATLGQKGFSEKIEDSWKNFRRTEALAPYSINLHYGPVVGAWSRPFFAFWLLIIVSIAFLIYTKRPKEILPIALSVAVGVMILGGVRLVIDHIDNTSYGWKQFAAPQFPEKKFFELRDYISVTNQVREKLDLDNVAAWKDKKCTIYASAYQDRPFRAHWQSVYLRPCELVLTGSMADYNLSYGTGSIGGEVILSGVNFVLSTNSK